MRHLCLQTLLWRATSSEWNIAAFPRVEKEKTELDCSDVVQIYRMETEAKHEASHEMKNNSFLHSYQVTTMQAVVGTTKFIQRAKSRTWRIHPSIHSSKFQTFFVWYKSVTLGLGLPIPNENFGVNNSKCYSRIMPSCFSFLEITKQKLS